MATRWSTRSVPIINVHIEYARARVGRWEYDGKITTVDDGPPAFGYTQRTGTPKTTNRFKKLG